MSVEGTVAPDRLSAAMDAAYRFVQPKLVDMQREKGASGVWCDAFRVGWEAAERHNPPIVSEVHVSDTPPAPAPDLERIKREAAEDERGGPEKPSIPELSPDIALLLAQARRKLPDWYWNAGSHSWGCSFSFYTGEGSGRVKVEGYGETVEAAFTEAFDKARQRSAERAREDVRERLISLAAKVIEARKYDPWTVDSAREIAREIASIAVGLLGQSAEGSSDA